MEQRIAHRQARRDARRRLAARPVSVREWLWKVAPTWLLEKRLAATRQSIDRLERLLSDEFGLAEMAPLHRDLAALVGERRTLESRLRQRAWPVTAPRNCPT